MVVELNLFIVRETKSTIRYVALQDFNLVFEGPHEVPGLKDFLAEFANIEQCIVGGGKRPDRKGLSQFGKDLASALFPGDIKQLVSVPANVDLRVGICTPDPELKQIPWEYLVWPNDKSAPNERRTLARVVPVANGGVVSAIRLKGRPLKICLVVSNPSNLGRVPWDDLKRQLDDLFGAYLHKQGITSKVELDIVPGATRHTVLQSVGAKDYDVVHFIGHGSADGLHLMDPEGKSKFIDSETLSRLFGKSNAQLVILSACNTASQTSTEIGSLSEYLVSDRMPAVIGSQFPLPNSAVAAFCSTLYQKLIATGDIDKAVAAGRAALSIELESSPKEAVIEWGIPVLYRRPGRSKLFS